MFSKRSQSEQGHSSGYQSGGGAPRGSDDDLDTAAEIPGPATSGTGSSASTVLAEGSKFVGKANVTGSYRVEGEAEGDIATDDALVVGRSGNVRANVTARRAVVNGKLKGKIEATEGVEFQSGSRVQADIKAKNMVMEDGVNFRGDCHIGS